MTNDTIEEDSINAFKLERIRNKWAFGKGTPESLRSTIEKYSYELAKPLIDFIEKLTSNLYNAGALKSNGAKNLGSLFGKKHAQMAHDSILLGFEYGEEYRGGDNDEQLNRAIKEASDILRFAGDDLAESGFQVIDMMYRGNILSEDETKTLLTEMQELILNCQFRCFHFGFKVVRESYK